VLLRLPKDYPAGLLDTRNSVEAVSGLESQKPWYKVLSEHFDGLLDLNSVTNITYKLVDHVIKALVAAICGVVVQWQRHEQVVLSV